MVNKTRAQALKTTKSGEAGLTYIAVFSDTCIIALYKKNAIYVASRHCEAGYA